MQQLDRINSHYWIVMPNALISCRSQLGWSHMTFRSNLSRSSESRRSYLIVLPAGDALTCVCVCLGEVTHWPVGRLIVVWCWLVIPKSSDLFLRILTLEVHVLERLDMAALELSAERLRCHGTFLAGGWAASYESWGLHSFHASDTKAQLIQRHMGMGGDDVGSNKRSTMRWTEHLMNHLNTSDSTTVLDVHRGYRVLRHGKRRCPQLAPLPTKLLFFCTELDNLATEMHGLHNAELLRLVFFLQRGHVPKYFVLSRKHHFSVRWHF